jgi:DNA-3-methyladenine glycosylase
MSSANVSPASLRVLHRQELPIATIALARYLLGKIVVREVAGVRMTGCIVETEAYPPRDPAAHHYRGLTPRNRAMFGQRGHAYVYFTYGNHFMLNVTAEVPDVGGGVLIRALEPLEGIPFMQRNRRTTHLRDLTRGPGRLAQALQIDRQLDGVDLCSQGPLWLADAGPTTTQLPRRGNLLGISTRIGITRASHRRLRFFVRGNAYVSGPRSLNR